jgi:hypothetical protein
MCPSVTALLAAIRFSRAACTDILHFLARVLVIELYGAQINCVTLRARNIAASSLRLRGAHRSAMLFASGT